MRLISLELWEWRAFEHCPIEFPDGLIGVGGVNGAGKTTIAEAVGWALFGKLRAGAKVGELRRQEGAGRPTAELVFQLDDVIYTVRRVASGDCALWIGDRDAEPEATGATNVSRRIAQELDLGWDIFKRTVFAEQKDVAALDPKATGPSRRAHVERLLGLSRFKRAADQAKGAVKEIDNEIKGRLAELEDRNELEVALAEAEKAAELESPRVNGLIEQLAKAKKDYRDARKTVEREHERVKQAAVLEQRQSGATKSAKAAEDREKELKRRIAERDKGRVRLKKLEPDASEAPAAQTELAKLDELADASEELNEAHQELAAMDHDPEAAKADEKQRESLIAEQAQLGRSVGELDKELEQLERRAAALGEVKEAGKAAALQAEVTHATQAERRLGKETAVLTGQLEEDRAHVAAVETGGPGTPCPVCRKPYGDEYEQILAEHREDIAVAEKRLPELEAALEAARRTLDNAQNGFARAREAEKMVERTEGPGTLSHAERRLATVRDQLDAVRDRLLVIEEELPDLGRRVTEGVRTGCLWGNAGAVVKERERRFARAAKALGVETYKPAAHERARKRSKRLSEVAGNVAELRTAVAAASGAEEELVEASDEARARREEAASRSAELRKLGVTSGELDRLREGCDASEVQRDQLTEELSAARLEAQERSQEVKECRSRLKAVRKALAEAEKRRKDLRQYQVVADLLERFREHESRRAWPQLQRGASALLAAATDGRYADVRLSTDYRLAIVDRGEEHGLSRYSGGEQDLANLCLRLAIAEWVARERGAEIGLLVLDEVFGSQDEERQRLLMDLLRDLSARFRQVVIITHVPEIAEMCDARIEVSMDDERRSTALVAA